MSLKYAFAKVMNTLNLHHASFFNEQLCAAVESDDNFKVENVLRANPDDARSVRTMFAFAVSKQKFTAAEAMIRVVPAVLAKDYSAGEDFINRTILMQRTILGDSSEVKFLIGQGASVRAADENGDTALHFAAAQGKLEAADMLAVAGADITAPNKQGITPLMESTKRDTSQMVEKLIAMGAAIDTCDKNGFNATMHALHNQNIEAATLLLQKGGVITDFSNPAIEKIQRVATYEGQFEFLTLLGRQIDAERQRHDAAVTQGLKDIAENGIAKDITVRPIRLKSQTP